MKKKIVFMFITVLFLGAFITKHANAAEMINVYFNGTTAPVKVNIRTGPGTEYPVVETLAPNTKLEFRGYTTGTTISDYWLKTPDNRWFYLKDKNAYISSALVNGNPPPVSTPQTNKPSTTSELPAMEWVNIAETGVTIVDSYNGVNSYYIRGNTDTGEYCCARYASRYFQQIHGITLYNLLPGQTPKISSSKYNLIQISPENVQPGDLAFWNGTNNIHSAIIKQVSGNTATVIEQNWKWNNKGAKNRSITLSSSGARYFRAVPK